MANAKNSTTDKLGDPELERGLDLDAKLLLNGQRADLVSRTGGRISQSDFKNHTAQREAELKRLTAIEDEKLKDDNLIPEGAVRVRDRHGSLGLDYFSQYRGDPNSVYEGEIPDGDVGLGLDGRRPAVKPAATAAPQPAAPVKPAHMSAAAWTTYNEMENGKSYFDQVTQQWRTRYGGLVRIADNKGNTVKWQDLDGNDATAPRSMQMMAALNAGYSPNMGTAKSWDDAIKMQQAGKNAQAEAYARAAINANMSAREQAKKRSTKQTMMVGDQIGSALADLNENMKQVAAMGDKIRKGEEDAASGIVSLTANDTLENSTGNKGAVHKAKDGNYYVRGIVRVEALDGFNSESAKLGGKDKAERIVASQRVDQYGNPIGEPTFSILYRKNGLINEKGDGVFAKQLTLGAAMRSVADAQTESGQDEAAAQNYTISQFGGRNPFGWKVNDPSAEPASVLAAKERNKGAIELEKLKQQGRIDLSKLNAEQKRELSEAANALKKYGIDIGFEETKLKTETQKAVTDANNAEAMARTKAKATSGVVNERSYTDEQVEKERKSAASPAVAPAAAAAVEPAAPATPASPTPASSGDNVIDVSNIKDKAELNAKLKALPDGSTVTLGGVTRMKRNGKWETTK